MIRLVVTRLPWKRDVLSIQMFLLAIVDFCLHYSRTGVELQNKNVQESQYYASCFQDTLLKSRFVFIKMTENDKTGMEEI